MSNPRETVDRKAIQTLLKGLEDRKEAVEAHLARLEGKVDAYNIAISELMKLLEDRSGEALDTSDQ